MADGQRYSRSLKFIVTGLVTIAILVAGLSVVGYYYTRMLLLQGNIDIIEGAINHDILASIDVGALFNNETALEKAGLAVLAYPHVLDVALFDVTKSMRWSSTEELGLTPEEIDVFDLISKGNSKSLILDHIPTSYREMKKMLRSRYLSLTNMIPIRNEKGHFVGVFKVLRHYVREVNSLRKIVVGLFLFVLFSNLFLFVVLYYSFWRGIQTIERQEKKLNNQVSRLSTMLEINNEMQQSMKSASRRAVELNEQFLRRVGSDLHDGPAQSIGYAVLRLDQVSRSDESAKLGYEYHAVKEALDDSLEEIREISSGLVLPELEKMTLEQSLKRVVSRHKSKSLMQVSEYYNNLPEEIPLPIKICAYRFLQEGLNNAYRHGQAKKCRITAQINDDVLHLLLKDNGIGFRKSRLSADGKHLGLMGLKDRIESLGGKLSINSELGVGTAIKFSVQLYEE